MSRKSYHQCSLKSKKTKFLPNNMTSKTDTLLLPSPPQLPVSCKLNYKLLGFKR